MSYHAFNTEPNSLIAAISSIGLFGKGSPNKMGAATTNNNTSSKQAPIEPESSAVATSKNDFLLSKKECENRICGYGTFPQSESRHHIV